MGSEYRQPLLRHNRPAARRRGRRRNNPPPVRRGVLIQTLSLLLTLAAPSGTALAASDVQLEHASDGTLVIVGSGWHRGQDLVISLGKQRFTVRVDSSGEFELLTGLATFRGELAVHHAQAPALAFAALPAAADAQATALAVDLARSVAEGMAQIGRAHVGTPV